MAGKKAQRNPARKARYQAQFNRTEANKRKHIAIMKLLNPNFPGKKEKK